MNSVILQVREFRWQRYTRVQKCHPAYAFVEALVVVCPFDPIQCDFTCTALIDSDGRAVRCNLRNFVFNIPQGETHVLRLVGMCSLYCGFCFTRSLSVLTVSCQIGSVIIALNGAPSLPSPPSATYSILRAPRIHTK